MTTKLLIVSPIRQKPQILREFLAGLERLDLQGIDAHFMFADDNDDAQSSGLLELFMESHEGTLLRMTDRGGRYQCDENTHGWREELIARVAGMKNFMLHHAREQGFDHVFLVDSDIVLHPRTVLHLVSLDKPVVSEVFWTQWRPEERSLPQVWLYDHYTMHRFVHAENHTPERAAQGTLEFLSSMRDGQVHEVGGLGACTLITRAALEAGVNFDPVRNVSFWGEDRAFCIRAAVLGVSLWADTKYPPLHLYRESELERLPRFLERIDADFMTRPKLTLSMIVRNEAGRYLRPMLEQMAQIVDNAVIIDDNSTDGTVELIHECLAGIEYTVHRLDRSIFDQEFALRRLQWDLTVKTNPDWILNLDADEIFEPRAVEELRKLLHHAPGHLVGFRLYDFWDEGRYRDDANWSAHHRLWPMLFRYTPDFAYRWNEKLLHTGRFPENLPELPMVASDLRLKHLGWMKAADRQAKYDRYRRIDPNMEFCVESQMESILDEAPNLINWSEQHQAVLRA